MIEDPTRTPPEADAELLAAYETLHARVRDWRAVPYRQGEDEAYDAANQLAEDAVLAAAEAIDALHAAYAAYTTGEDKADANG